MSPPPATLKIIIDHLAGSRRGQRQELAARDRVRFGRHPDCEVSFDAVRDIDASSRHAELRSGDGAWTLVDVGSSNGTYVDGHRVTEAAIAPAQATIVEFGSGGPRLRLFIGDDEAIALLPTADPPRPTAPLPWPWIALATVLVLGAAIALILVL